MANEKQYPQCNVFGDHLLVTVNNTNEVDEESSVIYFMESDGAHKYFGDKITSRQANNNER